ncbi:pyridoxal phosphate-dependent aminotransferase EpsN [Fontibacillus phaseoli]|uniref:Pyridoxal phosphate-dependent aminotransferase EpsN n=1 Tax=Fontibacillus phaseoli TaxID=1416533 RepID=A0A369BF01_9BACL|nr:DegT/DnrJ/EryC1/StrS family aminotransferase [Fontibacillus phaseoli]RCX19067.1 pyridoxal phosphate-dependent aminotransferase EpsN [Fontibacillus phaseoli]
MSGYDRIYLASPHMGGNEQKYINRAFETNWIAPLGENVDLFEQEIASYAGSNGALALSSGTAAIHLALILLGVGRDDVVFCSSLTFIASANPILYQGAIPVFIDSEPDTWNMSPSALRSAFELYAARKKLPKAVVVVNLYGQSADYNQIKDICDSYGVPIVEDAAESLGATYHGKRTGGFGKFGIFSFNGNKIITTSGGGMLVSDDTAALEKARFYSTQARDKAIHYQHSELGYNYRLSNVLAGIGRGQLEVLDERINKKREIFERYREQLQDIDSIRFMPEANGCTSTRWLTVMTIDPDATNKKTYELINYLQQYNIESRPVWKPLHMQPLFQNIDYFRYNELDVSQNLFYNGVCLPSDTNMTENTQDFVIDKIRAFFHQR